MKFESHSDFRSLAFISSFCNFSEFEGSFGLILQFCRAFNMILITLMKVVVQSSITTAECNKATLKHVFTISCIHLTIVFFHLYSFNPFSLNLYFARHFFPFFLVFCSSFSPLSFCIFPSCNWDLNLSWFPWGLDFPIIYVLPYTVFTFLFMLFYDVSGFTFSNF